MAWTCEKCATMHDTDEQRERCAARERKSRRQAAAILFAIVVIVAGIDFAMNQYAYGDWKCAFMHCRKLVP